MVPKAHWDEWSKLYEKSDVVRKGLVFSAGSAPATQKEAVGQKKVSPVAPPITVDDADKSNIKGVTDIAVAERG